MNSTHSINIQGSSKSWIKLPVWLYSLLIWKRKNIIKSASGVKVPMEKWVQYPSTSYTTIEKIEEHIGLVGRKCTMVRIELYTAGFAVYFNCEGERYKYAFSNSDPNNGYANTYMPHKDPSKYTRDEITFLKSKTFTFAIAEGQFSKVHVVSTSRQTNETCLPVQYLDELRGRAGRCKFFYFDY